MTGFSVERLTPEPADPLDELAETLAAMNPDAGFDMPEDPVDQTDPSDDGHPNHAARRSLRAHSYDNQIA